MAKLVSNRNCKPKKKTRKTSDGKKSNHPKFGTSKLEKDFAKDFLDKLGVCYIYEYFASQIGRYYDFAIVSNNDKNLQFETKDGLNSVKQDDKAVSVIMLLEIDGSYYHSDPRLVKESEMSPMQKRNKRVDELKNEWALMHGIPIMRIWEKDIREKPNDVMDALKKRLYIENDINEKKNEKGKRHTNKLRK